MKKITVYLMRCKKIIEIILKNNKSLKLVSLTKTKYKFYRKSVNEKKL